MKRKIQNTGGLLLCLATMTATLHGCSLEQIRAAFYNDDEDISCQQSNENAEQPECEEPDTEERVDYRHKRDLRHQSWEEDF